MSRLAAVLALAACTLRPYDYDATATDATTTASSTTAPDPTTTTATTDPSTTTGTTTSGTAPGSTGSTGQPFITPKDGGGGGTKECDQWFEDCPDGEKCQPYDSDGDNAWNSLKCVPIVPNPDAVGEPCEVFDGPLGGKDTCGLHAMCWYVDPDTDTGICVAKCTGSPDQPKCEDPDTSCPLSSDAVLILCLPECDPLQPVCIAANHTCIPYHYAFYCVLDASGDQGQAHDPCEYLNACDPGLYCAPAELSAGCDPMAPGCCIPFCDLTVMPPTCPGEGQQCLPWFEDGQAPPKYEHLGVCALPL